MKEPPSWLPKTLKRGPWFLKGLKQTQCAPKHAPFVLQLMLSLTNDCFFYKRKALEMTETIKNDVKNMKGSRQKNRDVAGELTSQKQNDLHFNEMGSFEQPLKRTGRMLC